MVGDSRQYQVLFQDMAQGAFFLGMDGYPLDVNPAALEMLGVTREQFMSRTAFDSIWQIKAKDGTAVPQNQYPSTVVLQTGRPVRNFIGGICHAQNGQCVWLNINAVPVAKEDSSEKPDQSLITLHDITHQKQMNDIHAARLHLMQFAMSHTLDELLVETLDRLELLTDSEIGFYHFYDKQTKRITLKQWSTRTTTKFCHIEGLEGHYGLDDAGIWADSIREKNTVIHNDYAALMSRKGLPEGHAPVIRELAVPVLRQGEVVAILGVGNKAQDYGESDVETVQLFADLAWDIAEHKLSQEALRQSEHKFKMLFENSPEAVFLTIPDGQITDCNPAASDMLGWTKEEILQRGRSGIMNLQDARLKAGLQLRQGQGKVQGFELTAIRKNGEIFPIEVDSVVMEPNLASPQSFVIMRDISARKRVKEELQTYKTIISSTEDLVSLVGIDYRYLIVNDAYLELHNKSRQEIVGHRVDEIIGKPAFEEAVKPQLDRCFAGQKVRYQTWVDLAKAGRRCFDITYTPYVEGETIKGAAVVGRDITDIKNAEETLQHTQAILQAAMDHSPAGIAIADAPDGTLRYVNDAGLFMRGSSREQVVNGIGLDQYVASWQLLDLDERPLETEEVPLARAILYGETCQREFIIRQTEGDDHIVSAKAAPIKDESGKVQAAIVVFTNITDQKLAEEQSRNLTKRLLLATSSAQLGVWEWNVRDNSMIWDKRMFELYGIQPENSPDTIDAWINGLHPDDKEAAMANCQAALIGEREFDTNFRVLHPDGTVKHIKANGLVITGTDGEAERMIGINADITDQKLAEEEREQLKNQLLQAQKIESIGQLAGGVAHDFNNMLGVIMGHADMALRKKELSAALINHLEQIRLAAKHSSELTRQLLTFARKQAIAPKILDLNDTVSGMLKMLRRLIGENIRLSWNPGSNLWPVKVDSAQMDQILANLCVNARDAIQDAGNITIQTTNIFIDDAYCESRPYVPGPGAYVQLSVSDDGIGMDQKTQAHIFEPFFTTKGIGVGTGLGLATVYGAVRQNNGFITFTSDIGRGTTFNIYLPRETAAGEISVAEQGPEAVEGTETILLVEDDEMLLQMGTAILEEFGYQVFQAAAPDIALSLAKQHSEKIDLLISDMIMPGMNGRELAKKVEVICPGVKVLFMSGYSADIISKEGILEDGIQFLQKPAPLETFIKKVREVLDQE